MSKLRIYLTGAVLVAILLFNFVGCAEKGPPADLVLLNGDILTVNPDSPSAKGLVITGNKVTAVCQQDSDAKKYIGDETRVIDLEGKFVTPGMIDGHVHFGGAGRFIIDANLMTVSEEQGLNTH